MSEVELLDRELCQLSDFAMKFDQFDGKQKIEIRQVPVYNEMRVLQMVDNRPQMKDEPTNIREELETLMFVVEEFGFERNKVGNEIHLIYEEAAVKVTILDGQPKMAVNADQLWDLVQSKAMILKQKRG